MLASELYILGLIHIDHFNLKLFSLGVIFRHISGKVVYTVFVNLVCIILILITTTPQVSEETQWFNGSTPHAMQSMLSLILVWFANF